MKFNHKQKLKLARKMLTHQEIQDNVSPFLSNAWNQRREFKQLKQEKQKENSKTRKKIKIFAS